MSSCAGRVLQVLVITPLAIGLATPPARGEEPPVGNYVLGAESSAAVGCLDLCDCLLRLVPDLDGSFTLELAEAGATFTRYRVEDVQWVIGDETPIVARGSGTFEVRIEGGEEIEAFDLLLSVNDEEPQAFSSAPRVRDEAADAIHADVRPSDLVCAGQVFQVRAQLSERIRFVRSDCNADGATDVADAVRLLFTLFSPARETPCDAACDANGDGKLDVSDPVAILVYLFLRGDIPPPPFPACGVDASLLGCASFPACA